MKRVLLALVAACASSTRPAAVPTIATKLPADVDDVVAVAEVGDATVIFDRQRAVIVHADSVTATVQAPGAWRGGATIAALDGEGRWAVGISDAGRLYRITLAGDLEDITDRFRIADVRGIAAAGATTAFSLGDGVAVSADGVHEVRAKLAAPTAIAASRGRIAMIDAHGIAVWDLAHNTSRTYSLAARSIAWVGGRLAAATATTVYLEDGGGLRDLHVPARPTAIAAAGARLWILAGSALYALDGSSLRRATIATPQGAHLFAAAGGDAWLSAHGGITRASLDTAVDDPAWHAQIQPVFARVCAHCHLPGGSAGVDLSTAASWQADHDELVRRVVVTRTMPPAGTDLTAADRDALAGWLTSQRARGAASTSR